MASVMGDHIPTCQGHVGYIGAWRGVQEKTKFADLGVSVMDNKSRRIKLLNTVVNATYQGRSFEQWVVVLVCIKVPVILSSLGRNPPPGINSNCHSYFGDTFFTYNKFSFLKLY